MDFQFDELEEAMEELQNYRDTDEDVEKLVSNLNVDLKWVLEFIKYGLTYIQRTIR